MTWDGVVTRYHSSYIKEMEIYTRVEAYIQYKVLKKALKSVSFDRRRGHDEQFGEEIEAIEKLIKDTDALTQQGTLNTNIKPDGQTIMAQEILNFIRLR